jgi:hypothetical protein
MTKAQPRHPTNGRFVKGISVKQAKPKSGTQQPKSGKK